MTVEAQGRVLTVTPQNIPEALKGRRRWVCWRSKPTGNGHMTKVPYIAGTDDKASSTDSLTWRSFERTLSAYERGGYDGIGCVVTEKDGITFIDLDHCRDAETGSIEPWAQTILERLQSCSEISPSGTGIRIVVLGALPPTGRKHGDIEMYDSKRFCTFTGHHLEGTPRTIESRQNELDTLHEETFGRDAAGQEPEPVTYEPSGEQVDVEEAFGRAVDAGLPSWVIEALEDPDDHGEDSISQLDFAVVRELLLCLEPHEVEAVWYESNLGWALHNDGTAKTRGRPDYRKRTIEKALARNRATQGGEFEHVEHVEHLGHLGRLGRLDANGVVQLSTVTPEPVEWLWRGYIPRRKVTILDGDPDLGKTTMMLDIAARVTTGRPMPFTDDTTEAVNVLLMTAEDDLSDTILPRFNAAEGNADKLFVWKYSPQKGGGKAFPSLADIDGLSYRIKEYEAKLVIVDPLMAYLGKRVDAHKDQDVRTLLTPLVDLAQETGVTMVCIRHLNKGSGAKALYRGSGSIGFSAAVRAGLLVAPDPDDDDIRVLATLKHNLGPKVRSLTFIIVPSGYSTRVEWLGEVDTDADELLNGPEPEKPPSKLHQAEDSLIDLLKDGPVPEKQVQEQARVVGITESTLKRAKRALQVESEKDGDGPWFWTLPRTPTADAIQAAKEDQGDQEDQDVQHPQPTDGGHPGTLRPRDGGITPDAWDLLCRVECFGDEPDYSHVPSALVPDWARIAWENGIEVKEGTAPREIIEALYRRWLSLGTDISNEREPTKPTERHRVRR